MSDDGDLTLLLETNDPVELASVRSLLEGHDLQYVIQGEHHGALIGGLFGNPAIVPRVLVAQRDLQKAQELLAALPEAETEAQSGASLEGAVCPVHEKPALTTCGRCGTFLCAECKALGQPPMCEDCMGAEEAQRKEYLARKPKNRELIAVVAIFALLAVVALVSYFRH